MTGNGGKLQVVLDVTLITYSHPYLHCHCAGFESSFSRLLVWDRVLVLVWCLVCLSGLVVFWSGCGCDRLSLVHVLVD